MFTAKYSMIIPRSKPNTSTACGRNVEELNIKADGTYSCNCF
jgi:hypothetical protein